MRNNYDLIIFDCDGTLVNSHDMNHSIMAQIANEYGDFSYTMKSVEKEYLGVDYLKFFKMVGEKENIDIPDQAAERCVELALQNIPTMMCEINNVHETLQRLSPHYKFTVASNANKEIVLESLRALDLDQFFDDDKVVAGRAMATPKPAPDLFLLAAEKMNTDPKKCLVIEDSPAGATAGVAAGMDVFGFIGAAHDAEIQTKKLLDVGVKAVYADFIHIAEALGY